MNLGQAPVATILKADNGLIVVYRDMVTEKRTVTRMSGAGEAFAAARKALDGDEDQTYQDGGNERVLAFNAIKAALDSMIPKTEQIEAREAKAVVVVTTTSDQLVAAIRDAEVAYARVEKETVLDSGLSDFAHMARDIVRQPAYGGNDYEFKAQP